MKLIKATKSQVRTHNRQLVLRAIYSGAAMNRAALAQETALTKPTVSDLVAELMAEGWVMEEGLGSSTDSGGKRPRLLRFLPASRQVIGVLLHHDYALGILTHLDGQVIAEHQAALPVTAYPEALPLLIEIINGLVAQLSAPLLCLSVGLSAVVDEGIVRYAPRLDWHNVPLAEDLQQHYQVPVYVSNSTELAALAQFAFGDQDSSASLVTVLVDDGVGVGGVFNHSAFHMGSEIGYLRLPSSALPLEQALACDMSYLHLRQAAAQGDPTALTVQADLAGVLAHIFAWIIALLRPQQVSLAGEIGALGETFLAQTVSKTCELALPELVQATHFSIDETPNLVALGAAAKAIQAELGLI